MLETRTRGDECLLEILQDLFGLQFDVFTADQPSLFIRGGAPGDEHEVAE